MVPREIYESLREKIIWLDLKPESVLNISTLAKSFGVSRTPIKESLIHLESEGWVLCHGSHFLVTPLSLNRIKEITEIRSIIEIHANVWAMHRISPKELITLNELEKKILQIDNKTSNRQMIELDFKLHLCLYRSSKNSQLAQLLERLLRHYQRFWLSIRHEIESNSFFCESLSIIQAVKAKDEAKLRESSSAHIKRSVDEIMSAF
jgi:DNA-binding GntR family transcriptional regulator